MCLITDYSPENLTLSFTDKATNAVVEVAAAERSREASYLATYWGRKADMQCAANHEGYGELQGQDPDSGKATADVLRSGALWSLCWQGEQDTCNPASTAALCSHTPEECCLCFPFSCFLVET